MSSPPTGKQPDAEPSENSTAPLDAGDTRSDEQQQIAANEPTSAAPGHPAGTRIIGTFADTFAALRARKRLARHQALALALLVILVLGVITPLLITAAFGISAYTTYNTLRSEAYSGFQHLLNVKTIFTGAHANPGGMLDSGNLSRAQQQFIAARTDFTQARDLIDQSAVLQTITQYLPQYRAKVASARAASQIGSDVASIGQQLITTALTLAPRFRGPLLSETKTPLVTPGDIALIGRTMNAITPPLRDIEVQSHHLSLADLPLSAHQRQQMQEYLQLLPQLEQAVEQGNSMVGAAGWLLGVDQPRTFLVQTMDRAELRATGGFTGQYGELQISGGRIAPFSLHDISAIEYSDNSPTTGNLAPPAYRSWWPFANWGLRDANLSADFPTSAQLIIEQYRLEVHRRVDGVIMFTPFLIEHILQVTGPLHIPQYNETITAQNLEARLHYYQLDNAGIRKTELIEHVTDPAQARKLFTSRVAHVLMDTVRHAPPGELLAIGLQLLQDLKTRDLQVYVTNPQIESLLIHYGYAGLIDRSTNHDGIYIVQANVSASKASQYVRTIIHDTVTLDAQGGATHMMQLRLVYNQIGPVYGLDTYRDYIRVYVPPTAKFLGGDGFDTGTPLCGGPLPACAPDGIYPQDQLVCPTGQYQAGASAPMLGDPYTGQWHPLDRIGPPTNLTSDTPGRTMFGGFVVVPKNCTMTVTLSWYVPPPGHAPYDLLIQRQAATFPELDLSILPMPQDCASLGTAGLHFHGILTHDTSFALQRNARAAKHCYPGTAV
ncbi:MAG TPA: DUF4012 domain-containing protein [Ktedonobacteraceae bacterium]|nr:DUF4012 domain-containing protein [Ktedonobacteraceae bacterium]